MLQGPTIMLAPRPTRTVYAGGLDRSTSDERYRVKGGGCIVIGLGAGDRLTVIDPEGGQSAEVAPLIAGKGFSPAALGEIAGAAGVGLARVPV